MALGNKVLTRHWTRAKFIVVIIITIITFIYSLGVFICCMCVSVTVRVTHGICVAISGQPRVSVFSFHLVDLRN